MQYSKRLHNDISENISRSVRIEARIERELSKNIDQYRRTRSSSNKRAARELSILAEGDSWFLYVPHRNNVIFYLERMLNTEILNLARPGDEAWKMLTGRQKKLLESTLKGGADGRSKFDILLFSGGGNDLVSDDRFGLWLNDYERGMTAKDVINPARLKIAFDSLQMHYEELIRIRDNVSPSTHLLLHGYDFAIPDGRRICGRGPWLQPALIQRGVPIRLRRAVVKEFLIRFEKLLKKIARSSEKISVVPTQGVLEDDEWHNELHPLNPGFKKIANIFREEIDALSTS